MTSYSHLEKIEPIYMERTYIDFIGCSKRRRGIAHVMFTRSFSLAVTAAVNSLKRWHYLGVGFSMWQDVISVWCKHGATGVQSEK